MSSSELIGVVIGFALLDTSTCEVLNTVSSVSCQISFKLIDLAQNDVLEYVSTFKLHRDWS